MERLDKILSAQTGMSRKDSRRAIAEGAVCVNTVPVKKPETKIEPLNDKISLNGREVEYEKFVYYLLNKPAGLLTASTDSRRPTVLDLFKNEPRYSKLFAVGRLDKDTTGLLLITDDGEYAHKVISPKSRIEKEYEITVDAPIPETAAEAFEKGIVLADGTKCLPAKIKVDKQNNFRGFITVFEGKYHQIKRMLGTMELGVVTLRRLRIANLVLPEGLAEGEFVRLTRERAYSVLNTELQEK